MKTRWLVSMLLVSVSVPQLAHAQNTETGAVLGGVGGALAGAAIGQHNHAGPAGALIGGAVGLITGSAIGNNMDQKNQARAYQQQAAYYQQQQAYQMSRAASANDIISMSRNGLSDDVIINHIRQAGVQQRPDVNEVIMLHQQGVREPVIAAMQQASVGGPAQAPLPPPVAYQRPAVVVQPGYYAPPPYYYGYYGPGPYYRHWGPPPPPPGVSFGVVVGR